VNQALQDLIEHRRTTNIFEPNHTISDEQIEHLVHLATRAPTSFNLQNWRFLAVRTPEGKAKLRELAYDQAKVSEAAVTFIVIGQLADHSALEGRLAPSVDAGFMSPELVAGWVRGAKVCTTISRKCSGMKRYEALHLELRHFYMPPKCMGSALPR